MLIFHSQNVQSMCAVYSDPVPCEMGALIGSQHPGEPWTLPDYNRMAEHQILSVLEKIVR